jgi:hypothetical protein
MDYVGLSVFGTQDAARENAVKWPKLIATVWLESGRGFMIARTYVDIDEHYTLWGDPDDLLALVQGRAARFDDPG